MVLFGAVTILHSHKSSRNKPAKKQPYAQKGAYPCPCKPAHVAVFHYLNTQYVFFKYALKQMFPKLCPIRRAQISRRNVEYGPAPGLSFPAQAVCGPGIGHDDRCRKFRVGVQLQAVFNHMAVLIIPSGAAGADDKTAMGNPGMVTHQFFLADEMHRGVIIGKIVRHGDDCFLDGL